MERTMDDIEQIIDSDAQKSSHRALLRIYIVFAETFCSTKLTTRINGGGGVESTHHRIWGVYFFSARRRRP